MPANNSVPRSLATALALSLLLGSCGGGGTSPPAPTPTPTPGATPAPGPTPTPSPTPTASSYAKAIDLSVGAYLRSNLATSVVQERYTSDTPPYYSFESATATLDPDPQALIYEFNATTKAVNLYSGGRTIAIPASAMGAQTADGMVANAITIDGSTSGNFRIRRVTDQLALGELTESWAGFPDAGAKVTRETTERFVVGIDTRTEDIPISGTRSFWAYLTTSTVTYDGGSGLFGGGTLTVNYTARTINGSFLVGQASWITGKDPVTATLEFDGAWDPVSELFQGQITSAQGFAGTFRGHLYGPANQLGLLFTISRNGKGAAGSVEAGANG